MKMQLLEVAASILAAMLIMIFHEVPKSLLFIFLRRREETNMEEKNKWKWSGAFLVHQYIDPIGLLLAVTTYGGFSKPYMFRIRDRKTNCIIGGLGFFSFLCIYGISMYVLRWQYGMIAPEDLVGKLSGSVWNCFGKLFWIYMGILSMGMFITNLFPVSVFDMGLIIAGKSPRAYLNMIQKDSFVKIVVLLTMAVGLNANLALTAFRAMISMLGKMG